MIRFIIVLVYPSLFITSPGVRVMVIITINHVSFMDYIKARPHFGRPKLILFSLNEFLIILFSYNMMFFSDFIQDLEMKYHLGYMHILTITCCLVSNMIFLIIRTNQRRETAKKKQ